MKCISSFHPGNVCENCDIVKGVARVEIGAELRKSGTFSLKKHGICNKKLKNLKIEKNVHVVPRTLLKYEVYEDAMQNITTKRECSKTCKFKAD